MNPARNFDRRRPTLGAAAVAVAFALFLAACGGAPDQAAPLTDAPSALQAAPATAPASGDPATEQVPWVPGQWAPPPEGAVPIEVAIPSIDVNAAMPVLGLNDDGTLEVPTDYSHAGWYGLGPRPGEVGPAVIAGHVDSKTGPAVFYRLRELQPGDLVHVLYDSGHVATFEVRGSESVAKDAFPTAKVYSDTPAPALRVITCGGAFDRGSGHYRENVIAYATLLGSWQYEA